MKTFLGTDFMCERTCRGAAGRELEDEQGVKTTCFKTTGSH